MNLIVVFDVSPLAKRPCLVSVASNRLILVADLLVRGVE
jgi:hypothetical protein